MIIITKNKQDAKLYLQCDFNMENKQTKLKTMKTETKWGYIKMWFSLDTVGDFVFFLLFCYLFLFSNFL